MWATFADAAEPHALLVEGETAGFCSIDNASQLHTFYLRDEFEQLAPSVFTQVVDRMAIAATLPSTVDPTFLSLSLTIGGRPKPVALMFDHLGDRASPGTLDLRVASAADHAAAVTHNRKATDGSVDFLEPYLTERIRRQELYLLESHGRLIATGECRVDRRTMGYAHLGVVVKQSRRRQGMATQLMNTLVDISRAQDLKPVCSTEPDNVAASLAIHRAGFRDRHRVFRIAISQAA